jgi:hypothetical protein
MSFTSKPFVINTDLIQSLGLGKPYLHLEGSYELVVSSFSDLPVSQWIPAPASNLLPLLSGLSGFVVLPAYLKKGSYGPAPTIADFQLATTGSVAESETPYASSVREIKEEIGLETSVSSITRCIAFHHRSRTINAIVHCPTSIVRATDSRVAAGRDDKSQKVITWILMDNPTDVFERRRIASADIAGKMVVVADIADVYKLLSHFF